MKKILTLALTVSLLLAPLSVHATEAPANEFAGTIWEEIMQVDETGVTFPKENVSFPGAVPLLTEENELVLLMGPYSFWIEQDQANNRLLIELYPVGSVGATIPEDEIILRENCIQIGDSQLYAWGYWSALASLHTGEMIFELSPDPEEPQVIWVAPSQDGWIIQPAYFVEKQSYEGNEEEYLGEPIYFSGVVFLR